MKTRRKNKAKRKKRSETRDTLQEGSGSQLRVSITVSHHSDWWLTVFATLLRTAKETNIRAQHVLDPSTRRFPKSPAPSFCPVWPVLHCYQHLGYVTLVKWHLLVVVVVVVVRWCISAPHVWWYYCILHDEVNQTLLKVGSCPLLEAGRTATSTLRGRLEGVRKGRR